MFYPFSPQKSQCSGRTKETCFPPFIKCLGARMTVELSLYSVPTPPFGLRAHTNKTRFLLSPLTPPSPLRLFFLSIEDIGEPWLAIRSSPPSFSHPPVFPVFLVTSRIEPRLSQTSSAQTMPLSPVPVPSFANRRRNIASSRRFASLPSFCFPFLCR